MLNAFCFPYWIDHSFSFSLSLLIFLYLFPLLSPAHQRRLDSILRPHCLSAMASTSTPPCGLAPIHGLPPRAQAMLHRELLLVHVLLAQVHALLHIPLSIRTIPFMSRVTHPQLRAHLEGLDNTLLLALRLNHTAVHYTHELLTAMGLLHIIQQSPEQLEDELEGRTDFGDRASPSTRSDMTRYTTSSYYDLIANYQDSQYPDSSLSQSSAFSPSTTTSSSHTLEISLSPSLDQILVLSFTALLARQPKELSSSTYAPILHLSFLVYHLVAIPIPAFPVWLQTELQAFT